MIMLLLGYIVFKRI